MIKVDKQIKIQLTPNTPLTFVCVAPVNKKVY